MKTTDSEHVNLLCASIGEQLVSVLTSETFTGWLSDARAKPGDLLIMNNSFLHRDGIASRSKSIKYLYVAVEPDGQPSLDIGVLVSKQRMVNRFKRVTASQGRSYVTRPLVEAVATELADLGVFVFAVAGRIGDDLPVSVELSDAPGLATLQYAPSQSELLVLLGETLSINRIDDIDVVWRAVVSAAREAGITITDQLSRNFEQGYEELCEQAARPVYISDVTEDAPSILSEMTRRLQDQIASYSAALDVYLRSARNADAMNELMRIAYNFADGANALVTLVVGISDLKPLLCWLTMTAQSELTDRFAELPFGLVGRTKPSLGQYRDLISGARNRAFHDIFAFGRPFQVSLTGDAFKDAELRLFREYAKRSRGGLDFKDRELVELLSGFTRAAERPVPLGFWEGNLQVMEAVLEVARSMHRALVLSAPRTGTLAAV
jgi:hypothetical protein